VKKVSRSLYYCRLSDANVILRKLDNTYSAQNPNPYSIDNNMYRTQFLLDAGGFPIDTLAVDALLFRKVKKMGKLWMIDRTVVCQHLKGSLSDYLKGTRKSYSLPTVLRMQPPDLKKLVKLLATSPFRGLHLSFAKHCPSLFWFYPSYRLMVLLGLIQGRSRSLSSNICEECCLREDAKKNKSIKIKLAHLCVPTDTLCCFLYLPIFRALCLTV
jgi:hypothetical protein